MATDHREHIKSIRSDFHASPRVIDSLNNSIRTLARDLYSKDTHFVFELIQNAEDNEYGELGPSLSFRLTKTDPTGTRSADSALIIQNNEIGFSQENVEAICAVGKTTKNKIHGYIGEKGIGFKSVFRVTSTPHIFSNGYRFCLPEKDEEAGLGYIVPRWIEEPPQGYLLCHTTIILPLDKKGFGYDTIEKMLRDIEPETILFLSKLKEIQITTDSGDALTILKDDSKMPLVQILVEGEKQGESFSEVKEFLLYTQAFDRPEDINQENRVGIVERDVSIAFPLNGGKENTGKVFAYLPVRSDTGFPFLINADFILTSSREEIQAEPSWNLWLMKCVAEVVADSLLHLKQRDLLTVALLEALASRMRKLPEGSMFRPISDKVKTAIRDNDLLPTSDFQYPYVSASRAVLARSRDMTRFLSPDQLSELLQRNHSLRWLSSDISETSDLWKYLVETHNINAIDADGFASKITTEFLLKQDDEWMLAFYKFLQGSPSLWNRKDAPLRKKAILRLEDGSHVMPIDETGRPNAYLPSEISTRFPTVKRVLADDTDVNKFLRSLGILEPDLFAEVIDYVLPKYHAPGCITLEDNVEDLRKIGRCVNSQWGADKVELRAKLRPCLYQLGWGDLEDVEFVEKIEAQELFRLVLKKVQLFLAVSANEEHTRYRASEEMYERSPDMERYFDGNPDPVFLASRYPDDILKLFKSLSPSKFPRIKKRTPDANGYVPIDGERLHARGLTRFDPGISVHGLDHALSNPTIEKSLFIWNQMVLPNAHCISGKVIRSTRQDFARARRSTYEEEQQISEHFGRLLMERAWLPDATGGFRQAADVRLDELPDGFVRDVSLARMLGVELGLGDRQRALETITRGNATLKEQLDLFLSSPEDVREKMMKLIPVEVPPDLALAFKEGLKNIGHQRQGCIESGDRETALIANPDRYQGKLNEEAKEAAAEHQTALHKISFSPVRNQPSNKEAREFLYVEYHGRCQVTETTFPKASGNANGVADNYFEACALLSYANAAYLNDAGNMLCVSADTMAKLKHACFQWLDDIEEAIESFRKDNNRESVTVRIRLAGEDCAITWKQRHFMRVVALYDKA